MQQTVANSRLSSKTILLYVTLLLSLIGCAPEAIYEPKLELKFNDIVVETTFTLKEYCKEKYDSIFIVQPYFDTKKEIFVDMNMSNGLRSLCCINTNSETISTILFIKDNKVKAYTVVEREKADFVSKDLEKHYIFPINQKFLMNKERIIRIYNE